MLSEKEKGIAKVIFKTVFTKDMDIILQAIQNICPFCHGEIGDGYGPVEIDDGEAFQEVTCDHCERVWSEVYSFQRIEWTEVHS